MKRGEIERAEEKEREGKRERERQMFKHHGI
jgi:hypothetical protein